MIARCTKTRLADLSKADREYCERYIHLDEVDLEVGRQYVIFGVFFREARPWFLICGAEDDQYPIPQFSGMFELVDGRVPSAWSLTLRRGNLGSVAILPEPWAADPDFLEKLVDGEPKAVAEFSEIRKVISVVDSRES